VLHSPVIASGIVHEVVTVIVILDMKPQFVISPFFLVHHLNSRNNVVDDDSNSKIVYISI
jgi:hypothetical protein